MTFTAVALVACGSSDTTKSTDDEEVTVADFSYDPDDDQTQPDGTVVRKGTASIYPDGKTDPKYPNDSLIFEAHVAPASSSTNSTLTLTDTAHQVVRVFYTNADGSKFGLTDAQGKESTNFTVNPDQTVSVDGVSTGSTQDTVAEAKRNAFFTQTPYEIFLLTYGIIQDGFQTSKTRGYGTINVAPQKAIVRGIID